MTSIRPENLFNHGDAKRAWRAMILTEVVMVVCVVVALTALIVVGAVQTGAHLFSNVGYIALCGAFLGEEIRRTRHLRDDLKEGPPE